MSEIPQYSITANRKPQPNSIKDKLGSLNTTPSNVGKRDQQAALGKLKNSAAVAQMDQTLNISSDANVLTESQKQAQQNNTIDSGANTMIVSKADVAKAVGRPYPEITDNLNPNTVKILQKHLETIQENNKQTMGPESTQAEVPMAQRKDYNDWVKVNINKDGTASIENYGVWDRLTGRTYGNSYISGWKPSPKMFASMVMPLLTYSNTVNSMDRANQIIYGTKTLGQVLDAARGGPGINILSDSGIMAIADLADMTHNWNDRTKMQRAQSMIDAYQSTSDALGYDSSPILDGFSLFTFGYGASQIVDNWDKMNGSQQAAAFYYLTMAGHRAFNGAENLYNWAVQNGWLEGTVGNMQATELTQLAYNAPSIANSYQAGAQAINAGTVNASNANAFTQAAYNADALGNTAQTAGTTVQAAETAETANEATQAAWNAEALGEEQLVEKTAESTGSTVLGGTVTVAGALYSGYSAYNSWDSARKQFGHGNADSRKAMAQTVGDAGQVIGTAIGAYVGLWAGAAVGSFLGRTIGAAVGVGLGSIKNGKSAEQRRRDMWRTSFSQAGIFYRMPLNDNSKTYAIKLADGSYYDVGVDGSGSRATDIRGNKKQFANPSQLSASDAHRIIDKDGTAREVLPYEVDYTNALDFGASLMLNGMIMPIGGSGQKNRAKEVGQMLGYMTNGVTSNCGREFTQDNWNTLVSNVRLQYANVGITDKSLYNQSLAEAYYSGRLSYDDYITGLLTMGWIYDEDGYQQASNTLGALGKLNGQSVTSGTTGNAAPAPITGDTRGISI